MDKMDPQVKVALAAEAESRRQSTAPCDAQQVAENIKKWLGGRPVRNCITLGSSLGGFGRDLPGMLEARYIDLGLPPCGVDGHAGILRYVESGGGTLIRDGRLHPYEEYDMEKVMRGLRAVALVGARNHILTTAVGGIQKNLKVGEFVLVSDHLNLIGLNPLRGPNDDKLGPRFPAMNDAYSLELRTLAQNAAIAAFDGKGLKEGVIATLLGPNYETPSEIRMLERLGADYVGMSTAPEVITLRHLGAKVLTIACVTNLAAGLDSEPPSHEEVKKVGAEKAEKFRKLLLGILDRLADPHP
ncbi:MAG: purine-nucleoside phosphorylase [Patescibacteria group bacterium]